MCWPTGIWMKPGQCCAWASGWPRSWRRCSCSSAISTGSTRSSTSRSRSPPWRRTGTDRSPAISTFSLGLTRRPPQDRPPLLTVFFGFRIMLAVGFFMIAAALYGAWLMWRKTLFDTRWYQYVVANTWWIGFVAVIAGWIVTETGRQPWIVYGIQRTADATSPVPSGSLATTLALFVLVYGVVFSVGIYYINRLIAKGPQARDEPPAGFGSRPLPTAIAAETVQAEG